jgi:hypothetical protein
MAYNGWTNWATWNVELWLGNDEGLYHRKVDFMLDAHKRGELSDENVEAFCRRVFPNGTPDMASAKRLNEVNWSEIAGYWRDEAEG